MDQLNRVSAYFNEKERRRLDQKIKESGSAYPEMSADEIRLSCLENSGYDTPELNDKLYLHFRGFRRIENLDAYTGCKCIWLDSNGFDKIENLERLEELRCLYLSKNLIGRIDGLATLSQLTILDLSYNRLTMLENLSCCPMLQTLNVSHNSLATSASIAHLTACLALTTLDITHNRLEADEGILPILQSVPALVTLSMNGNEATRIGGFRKRLIALFGPRLAYLDRPVDEQERFFATAYVSGGPEAEAKAREEWRAMAEAKRKAAQEEDRRWHEEQRQLRQQARSEGRVRIMEFTDEERMQRAAEAEAAALQERAMLSLGITRIGARVHQLEAQGYNSRGEDLLDVATKQLQEEDRRAAERVYEEPAAEEEEAEVDEETEVLAPAPVEEAEELLPAPPTGVAVEPIVEVPVVPPPAPLSSTAVVTTNRSKLSTASAAAVADEDDVHDGDDEKWEPLVVQDPAHPETEAELEARAAIVAESMAMYKQQLADEKASRKRAPPVPTWQAPIREQVKDAATLAREAEERERRPLYWSEAMDLALAQQVKATLYDFPAISIALLAMVNDGKLSSDRVKTKPDLLSGEACRLRWAQLDAHNWSQVAPGISAADTVFKVNVSEEVLKMDKQPSFEELMQLTVSQQPKYMSPPTMLPSMTDYADDSDDEEMAAVGGRGLDEDDEREGEGESKSRGPSMTGTGFEMDLD